MRGRRALWLLAAPPLLAAVALGLSFELRTFVLAAVAPARARDGLLWRLERSGGPELWLLGTTHREHLRAGGYDLRHVEAVIRRLRPDRLLVESRPEALAAGNLADGPIEMGYASLVAAELGLSFDGVDWWDEGATGPRRTDEVRDDRIAARLTERLPERGKVLILLGFAHLPEVTSRLAARGFVRRPVDHPEALFDRRGVPRAYPAGLAEALARRVAEDEAWLAGAPAGEAAERRREAVLARRAFLERVRAVGERPRADAR